MLTAMPKEMPWLTVGRATFSVESLGAPSDEVKELLAQTIWGSPRGLRYRNKSIQWSHLRAVRIFQAKDGSGRLVAAAVYAEMSWGYYLAAVAALRGHAPMGLAVRLCQLGFEALAPTLREGQAFAGLVVSDNRAAMRAVARAGLRPQTGLDAVLISRRWPRSSGHCRRIRPQERPWVLDQLAALRRGWQDAEHSLVDDEYFVCEEGGRIVAGLQACQQHLEVLSLGSRLDSLLLKGLPLLLGATHRDFRYLQVFHLWGQERFVGELCSHVLRVLDARLACIQLDPADPLWRPIRHRLRHGVAARLIGVDTMQIFSTAPVPRPMSVTPLMGTFA